MSCTCIRFCIYIDSINVYTYTHIHAQAHVTIPLDMYVRMYILVCVRMCTYTNFEDVNLVNLPLSASASLKKEPAERTNLPNSLPGCLL